MSKYFDEKFFQFIEKYDFHDDDIEMLDTLLREFFEEHVCHLYTKEDIKQIASEAKNWEYSLKKQEPTEKELKKVKEIISNKHNFHDSIVKVMEENIFQWKGY